MMIFFFLFFVFLNINFFGFAQIYYINENFQGFAKNGSFSNPFNYINEAISQKEVSQASLKLIFQSNITLNTLINNDFELILQYFIIIII